MTIILGLDPGLGSTGWGVIRAEGNRLSHIANGQIKTDAKMALASRLLQLDMALKDVLVRYTPDAVAVEEVFVNKNPQSTLKLGQARGVVLLGAARGAVPVGRAAGERAVPVGLAPGERRMVLATDMGADPR